MANNHNYFSISNIPNKSEKSIGQTNIESFYILNLIIYIAVSLCFFLIAAGNQRERSPGKHLCLPIVMFKRSTTYKSRKYQFKKYLFLNWYFAALRSALSKFYNCSNDYLPIYEMPACSPIKSGVL